MKTATYDTNPPDSIDRTSGTRKESGLKPCKVSKCCQEVCPEHILITEDTIIPEKEKVLDSGVEPLLTREREA